MTGSCKIHVSVTNSRILVLSSAGNKTLYCTAENKTYLLSCDWFHVNTMYLLLVPCKIHVTVTHFM